MQYWVDFIRYNEIRIFKKHLHTTHIRGEKFKRLKY